MTTETPELASCPFCGKPLWQSPTSNVNRLAKCKTDGCWMNSRMMSVTLDDPVQVAEWNRRATAPAEPAVGYVSQATLAFLRDGVAVGSTILAQPLGDTLIPLYAAPAAPPVAISEEMRRQLLDILTDARNHLTNTFMKDDAKAFAKVVAAIIKLLDTLSPAPAGEVGWRTVFDEMLAALKQIEAEMCARPGVGSTFGEARKQIRRAIARAKALSASPTGGDK